MTEIDREVVARRVRALLEKTEGNGCTEAEALAAAEKARALMDAYRLTQSDLEIAAEPIVSESVRRPYATRYAPLDYCHRGIERYCGVRSYLNSQKWDAETQTHRTNRVFLGLRSDVEMAIYLHNMLDGVIKLEAKRFAVQGRARIAFMQGMAVRICERLIEMAAALEPDARSATGTSLVVLKSQLVTEAYAKLGLHTKRYSAGLQQGSSGYAAGREAGNSVNLQRPVGGYGVRGRIA